MPLHTHNIGISLSNAPWIKAPSDESCLGQYEAVVKYGSSPYSEGSISGPPAITIAFILSKIEVEKSEGGMSTGAKIGIGVGAVAVLGVIIWAIVLYFVGLFITFYVLG